MRVILLKNIEKLGKKNDVKEVKDGYARNFLIPQGLAKIATKQDLKILENQKKIEEKKAEKELEKIQQLVTMIDGQEIIITVKVGEKEQLFESITAQKISEKLKELDFEVKNSQIELVEPIKELGEFPIKIKFEHNLEAEIRVIVTREEERADGR
ncbi:50S ribosomal protein L9 [Dehalococcoidia bacterium]|nr:50S ribosomal protein L9 [Dehalococcoidia bacterium]